MYLQPTKFNIIKNVCGFPLYSVDIYGSCRSLERGKSLAVSTSHDGYLSVRFCKEKVHKRFLLHRLVKTAFCGVDENKKYIDHKDDNPANNELINLRWVTQSENVKKSFDTGRAKPTMAMLGKIGKLHGASMEVVGYDQLGNEAVRFESISLARKNGYNLDFYKRSKDGITTNCKGLKFKRN